MSIIQNLESIQARIRIAEQRAGRPSGSVTLIAVSKTFPTEDVIECHEAGQSIFGENRVQEALTKIPSLPTTVQWHLIGPLQRNKVRKALLAFHLIHTVDSLKLAEYINEVAAELNITPQILLEVHVGGEETKFGFEQDTLLTEWGQLSSLPHLQIKGLMCIPPPTQSTEEMRPYFRSLVQLRDTLVQKGPIDLPELSMGMSHDFEIAIEEGATFVRVGTAIFGHRDYPA
ncbi:MAG: YggS family pyridoxal phosphate-dependent enzyme [Akkermansia sp.]